MVLIKSVITSAQQECTETLSQKVVFPNVLQLLLKPTTPPMVPLLMENSANKFVLVPNMHSLEPESVSLPVQQVFTLTLKCLELEHKIYASKLAASLWEAVKNMETILRSLINALTYVRSTHTLIWQLTCALETVTILHTSKAWLWELILKGPVVSVVNL